MSTTSSKEKSLIQAVKQEFKAVKPLLPNGWPLKLIDKFYTSLNGSEAVRKYIRIINIRDGNTAPTQDELRNIMKLVKEHKRTISKE